MLLATAAGIVLKNNLDRIARSLLFVEIQTTDVDGETPVMEIHVLDR
jgi:hypothetical protein